MAVERRQPMLQSSSSPGGDPSPPGSWRLQASRIRWAVAGLAAIAASEGLVLAFETAPGCPHDHVTEGTCLDLSTYHPHLWSGAALVAVAMAIVLVTVLVTTFVERRHGRS